MCKNGSPKSAKNFIGLAIRDMWDRTIHIEASYVDHKFAIHVSLLNYIKIGKKIANMMKARKYKLECRIK